jgi:hypothetical protein
MKVCQFYKQSNKIFICQNCKVPWEDKVGLGKPPNRFCRPGENNIKQNISEQQNKNIIEMPNTWTRMKSYADSYIHWNLAGRPMRSQEKIDQIFKEQCEKCEMYNGYACKICGCYINQRKYLNKIAWATTRCPGNPPKWIEEEGFTPAVIESPQSLPLSDNQIPQPPTESEIEQARIEAENNIVGATIQKASPTNNGGGGCGCNKVGRT